MNPIRRELLNGLLVLVIASLLSVAFSAFQVTFNALLWVLILMGIAIAVTGYIFFEITLRVITSAERRENEWLKRVGTPARLQLAGRTFLISNVEALNAMSPGSDYTVIFYHPSEGLPLLGDEESAIRAHGYSNILERLKQGRIREYKRIICFDSDMFADDRELRLGVLRVGESPGTFIDRVLAEHCRLMMATKGCSLYVAPVIFPSILAFYGTDKASMALRGRAPTTGRATALGTLFFCDPPNGDIIHELWDLERETERRMVAVHKIVFPEDAETKAVAR